MDASPCMKCGLRWPNHAIGCTNDVSRDEGVDRSAERLTDRDRRALVPVTWREWERVSRLACERLGLTLTELGDLRVVDVLRALRDETPEGVDEREARTCSGCGGLALEVDPWGRCRLCASDARARRA